MRRYSHLGPVLKAKGRPLSRSTVVELSRATLYRAVEGGNAHEATAQCIEQFAQRWQTADDTYIASLMRRWSEKRRTS